MPANIPPDDLSSYLDHLPAIYRQGGKEGVPHFLGRFLLAFEQVLHGLGDAQSEGIEELADRLTTFLDPEMTPSEFLPWLAGWVALSLREDWTEAEKRRFIRNIQRLYRLRGTPLGLKLMLATFTGLGAENGDTITIIEPTDKPYYFEVSMIVPYEWAENIERERGRVIALIDQERPAHTYYNRDNVPQLLYFVTMQLGVTSTIGKDTILGDPITLPGGNNG
ncbi:MAG: hypothetical protein J0M33_11550 [Anaerolineae bacterium]|nr:hypothetical protein [Anaerolineae bacterium]